MIELSKNNKRVEKTAPFSDQGFTLLEILIAITLLSMIMAFSYNIIESGNTTKDRIIQEDQNFLQVETALSRFKIDFNQIYTPLYYTSVQKKKKSDPDSRQDYSDNTPTTGKMFPKIANDGSLIPVIENPDKSTLLFFTTSNRRRFENTKQSNHAWVKYTLERTKRKDDSTSSEAAKDETFELVRYFQPADPYSREEVDWDQIKPQVLLKRIKELKFKFWSTKRTDYVDRLRETPNPRVIRGIKMELIWIDRNNYENNVERYFRNIWPYFDTSKDAKAIKKNIVKSRRKSDSD